MYRSAATKVITVLALVVLACSLGAEPSANYRERTKLVSAMFLDSRISPGEFTKFLDALNLEQRKALSMSLVTSVKDKEKIDAKAAVSVREIQEQILWMSSHWLPYLFRNENEFDYHGTVKWVAEQLKISRDEVLNATTFQLERRICEKIFVSALEKLSKLSLEEREKALKEIGMTSADASKIAGLISAGSGAALAALAVTEAYTGFAFYIMTAKLLAGPLAHLVGSFGVSSTVVTTVSVFCGPVGWTIAGVTLAGGAGLFFGTADVQRTAAFIVQVHYLKVGAMEKSGINVNKYILKTETKK